MSDFLTNPEDAKVYSEKFRKLYIIIGVVVALFFMRLWYLQIFKGGELRLFSEKNRVKESKLYAPRGMVLDREGRVLVDNIPGFSVSITPQYASKLKKTAKVVSRILNISSKDILAKVKKSRRQHGTFRPVLIKEDLTRDEVIKMEQLRYQHPGLEVEMSIKRVYLMKENGAQLFGYVGEISKNELPKLNKGRDLKSRFHQGDLIGKSGIEKYFDELLRGEDGLSFVQVDAFGRAAPVQTPEILSSLNYFQEPSPGYSLQLTIDKDIQEAAYKAFNGTDRIGSVVMLENKTGKILTWVNAPSYDPSDFAYGISPKIWREHINHPFKPLRNKAIQDHAPPGSTFKSIVALAALNEGVINEKTEYFCPGFLRFGRRRYHCHIKYGHGNVNVLEALERSCDVFFYKLGTALGIDKIAQYAKALGMGARTGVTLHQEVPGLMPTKEWKEKRFGEEWQPGENLSNAIGQGFVLTTPLQLAMVMSGLANEGPVYQPYFLDKVLDVNGNLVQKNEPTLKMNPAEEGSNLVIQKSSYEIVKEGMKRVSQSERGTARWYRVRNLDMAGKTGTVQLFSLTADQVFADCKKRPIKERHHGWFVGFAPVKNPEVTIAVFAEHSCSGSGGAAPVSRDVLKAYFEKYNPDLLKSAKQLEKERKAKEEAKKKQAQVKKQKREGV